MKTLLSKEDRMKIKLIKKYARIRFRRFWNEWGVSKEEVISLLSCASIFGLLFVLYIIGCIVY